MPRSEKLYQRLQALEHELRRRLVREFRAEVAGRHSRYRSRKYSPYLAGKQCRDTNTGTLESLEREVVRLRRKLKVDVPGPVVGLLEECVERVQAEIKPWAGGRVAIAKAVLAKL